MNEFQEEEQAAEAREKEKAQEKFSSLLTRLEEMEHTQLIIEEPIKELTPSDDLEAVKMRLNQLISTINKLAI